MEMSVESDRKGDAAVSALSGEDSAKPSNSNPAIKEEEGSAATGDDDFDLHYWLGRLENQPETAPVLSE